MFTTFLSIVFSLFPKISMNVYETHTIVMIMPHVLIQRDHFTVLAILVTQEMVHFVQVNIHCILFILAI